jgi:DNA-binding MarR family transcriptional regulator
MMTGNPLDLGKQLCFALYSTAHAFNRLYKPLLEPLGLTYPQYLVMMVLWEQDGTPVKSLGDRLMLDSGTLTPLLKRLEGMGLVARKRDAADERQVLITLTQKGHALREKAQAVPAAVGCATGLEAAEAVALKSELATLRTRLLAASKP